MRGTKYFATDYLVVQRNFSMVLNGWFPLYNKQYGRWQHKQSQILPESHREVRQSLVQFYLHQPLGGDLFQNLRNSLDSSLDSR